MKLSKTIAEQLAEALGRQPPTKISVALIESRDVECKEQVKSERNSHFLEELYDALKRITDGEESLVPAIPELAYQVGVRRLLMHPRDREAIVVEMVF